MDDWFLAVIKANRLDQVKKLIPQVDLTAVNKAQCTYMHYAVFHASPDIVRMLAQAAPSIIDAVDVALISPLHIACEKGRIEVVEVLLQEGSNAASFIDRYEYKPRDCAMRFGFTSVVEMLDQYKKIIK